VKAPISEAIQAGTALFNMIEKALPSDLERLERYRGNLPFRLERLQRKVLRARLRSIKQLRRFMKKYNLTEADLIHYFELTEKLRAPAPLHETQIPLP
jgi:hypothetical protein